MSKFMTEDFLLNTETARVLYHEHAEQMPIIDYHCHIPASDILNDVKFENITKLWLAADHYKWRLIRANGEDESLVTGPASDSRSFLSYTRHEYFRRILCRILGQWVEDGEYPADMETLGELVEDICCNNARAYFGL